MLKYATTLLVILLTGCSNCTTIDGKQYCSKESNETQTIVNTKPSNTSDAKPVVKALPLTDEEKLEREVALKSKKNLEIVQHKKDIKRCNSYLNDIKSKYELNSARLISAGGNGVMVTCYYQVSYPTAYGTDMPSVLSVVGNYNNNIYDLTEN